MKNSLAGMLRVPLHALRHEGCIEREHDGRQFRRRIGVREAPADRASRADGRVRDERHGGRNERDIARDHIAAFEHAVTGHPADPHAVVRSR